MSPTSWGKYSEPQHLNPKTPDLGTPGSEAARPHTEGILVMAAKGRAKPGEQRPTCAEWTAGRKLAGSLGSNTSTTNNDGNACSSNTSSNSSTDDADNDRGAKSFGLGRNS